MNILTILIVLALAATAIAFGWGIISMMHGGVYDERHSNQLMGARVGLQGLAVLLLLIAVFIAAT